MKFNPPLKKGILIKRYRRFLADIETESGEVITIHCPNTGSMLNCLNEGESIWYLPTDDPNRKTAGTWVLAKTPHNRIACVNTHYANDLVEEALNNGVIEELKGFTKLRREVRYGEENSRVDFCLDYENGSTAYVEVKSVTLGFENSRVAAFPDAVTERGTKHLRELTRLAEKGIRTVLFYCVNLSDIDAVRPAQEIDSLYAKTLQYAKESGLEVLAYGTELSITDIVITKPLAVEIED